MWCISALRFLITIMTTQNSKQTANERNYRRAMIANTYNVGTSIPTRVTPTIAFLCYRQAYYSVTRPFPHLQKERQRQTNSNGTIIASISCSIAKLQAAKCAHLANHCFEKTRVVVFFFKVIFCLLTLMSHD